jgi:hypothetical protein
MQALSPELWLRGAELAAMALVGWISLKIKDAVADVRDEQSRVKAELIGNQHKLSEDFNTKHAENKQNLAVHVARDEEQFKAIGETLDRIESKVDEVNDRSH